MKFNHVFLLVITLNSGISCVMAQAPPAYAAVKVGDKMPDHIFSVVNYATPTARISDFKGKVLIFDLWNTSCSSCIMSWPKLLALQKQFGGKLQIVLLNPHQQQADVRHIIEKRRAVGVDMTLPAVYGDTILGDQLFRHSGYPHVVWIDRQGYVKSITYGDALNAIHIQAMVNGEAPNMYQKTMRARNYNARKPLFINGNGGTGEPVVASSVLTRNVDGFDRQQFVVTKKEYAYSAACFNCSLYDLYSFAYSNRRNRDGSLRETLKTRVVLEVKDTTAYVARVNGAYNPHNNYTYQLITPPATQLQLQRWMQEDLSRYLGHDVRWERRRTKCLVLTAEDTSLIAYKGGKNVVRITDREFALNNYSVQYVVDHFENASPYALKHLPVIDETGFKGALGGIDIVGDVFNHEALDKALHRYKMRFTIQYRDLDMLVIRDAP